MSRILGVPIATPTTPLQNGQFLAFNSTQGAWTATTGVAGGQFVERATPQPYVLVAAGQVRFDLTGAINGQPVPGAGAAVMVGYNNLTVERYDPGAGGFLVSFSGFKPTLFYIVKLTPWAPKGSGANNPFLVYLSDFANPSPTFPNGGFYVTVWVNRDPGMTEGRFMLEVSQIGG